MNTVDYIIIAVILIAVAAAVFVIINDKKSGKGCCGNCYECKKSSCKDNKQKK